MKVVLRENEGKRGTVSVTDGKQSHGRADSQPSQKKQALGRGGSLWNMGEIEKGKSGMLKKGGWVFLVGGATSAQGAEGGGGTPGPTGGGGR